MQGPSPHSLAVSLTQTFPSPPSLRASPSFAFLQHRFLCGPRLGTDGRVPLVSNHVSVNHLCLASHMGPRAVVTSLPPLPDNDMFFFPLLKIYSVHPSFHGFMSIVSHYLKCPIFCLNPTYWIQPRSDPLGSLL